MPANERILLDDAMIRRALSRIAFEILEKNKGVHDLVFAGILSRGSHLAERVAQRIEELEQVRVPVFDLDVTSYRDDRRQIEGPAGQNFSGISDARKYNQDRYELDNKHIVLFDDVLYTGRTVRAAMDALMDMGRAQTIQLAVLIDRGHRELPIRPDYVGKNVPTSRAEAITVRLTECDGIDQVVIYQRGNPEA